MSLRTILVQGTHVKLKNVDCEYTHVVCNSYINIALESVLRRTYICLSSEGIFFGGEQMKPKNRIKINQNSHNSNKRGTGSRPFPTGGQFPSPKLLAYVVPNPIASQEERIM